MSSATTTTILFTDIVNSTELMMKIGDERAQQIFNAHRKVLQEALAANGGQEVKWDGDGLMAAFTSAADGVRCAIAIQRGARRLTAGHRLEVRAGLNVGEALPEEADYFGIPVVVAKRLCDLAEGGQILCSALVAGLLSGRQNFEFSDRGLLELKGVAEPVSAFEVVYDADPVHRWTEKESELYRQVASAAIPAPDEQIATMLALLPFEENEPFRVVELGCGEGTLSYAILDHLPTAQVTALDGSESMRDRASANLSRFSERSSVEAFQLESTEWWGRLEGVDCVVASKVLHHLPDADKLALFEAIQAAMSDRGALLVADAIVAQRPEPRALFADRYDEVTKEQAGSSKDPDQLLQRIEEGRWNIFKYGVPADEYLAPLFDQLTWLHAAGFEVVDCFWLRAGFAIFGGYKRRTEGPAPERPFERALLSAHGAIEATTGTDRHIPVVVFRASAEEG
jgi:class 3 adenylate cyclase/cyclopropane fatty-acyl-phospholipid synthase-like methyltransferase